jgi:hypothetical protein
MLHMAKKNSRSEKSTPPSNQPAPERRRTARAATRSTATPDALIAEPDGTPAVVRDTADETPGQGAGPGTPSPTYEQIAEAAYHRYLQRGGQHGQDFDDWLHAERSLRSRE